MAAERYRNSSYNVGSARRPLDQSSTISALSSNSDAELDQPSSSIVIDSESASQQIPRKRLSPRRFIGVSLFGLGILLGVALVLHSISATKQQSALEANAEGANARIKQQSIPLLNLSNQLSSNTAQHISTVTVNGQVNVGNSLVVQPTSKPATAVPGQIYYDQSSNLLSYYNGKGFVGLQGGGNVTNNVTNNAAPITNTTDVTNVNGSSVSLQGTAGTLAMFSGSNSLSESLITETGSIVNVGGTTDNLNGTAVNAGSTGNNETVAVGSLLGTSTTALQAGTGNLSILTGSQTGGTGNIMIQSGDSSTTAAGNISIDTGNSIINGTLIADKTFEDGIDNMGDSIFGDNSALTQDCSVAHLGFCSLAVSVGGNYFPEWGIADGVTNPPMIIPATAGHTYALSTWVRAGTTSCTITASVTWSNDGYYGGGAISSQNFGTVTDISTGWRHITGILTAPAGTTEMGFAFISDDATSIGEVHYFDDISITDLSSSTSTAAINIGATNAQIINIGNSGMLAPTSIYGSGVNIAAGNGIMNLSATTLTASAGGASLTTTSGALDLTAAASSTWEIGNSSGAGGDLNIAAGNAGGNDIGGNLTLQAGAGSGTGMGGSVYIGTGSGATLGYTTVGNFGYSNFDGFLDAAKYTTTTGGTIQSISVRIGDFGVDPPPTNQYQVAIYADNAGAPGAYIASSAIGTLSPTAAWDTLPITATLAPTTSYWLIYWTNDIVGGGSNAEIGTPGSGTDYVVADDWQTGGDNGMPAAIPTGGNFFISNTSIFATYAGSAPAVTIDTFGTLTQNGAALFQDPADIPNAFQIQNSAGTALLTADTSAMTITIGGTLTVNGNLTVNGHIITAGTTPAIAAGAAACTSPTVNVTGNDTSGIIDVTTGTGCSSGGILASITFANPYGSAPHVTLTPVNANTQLLGQYVDGPSLTANSFSIGTANVPSSSTTYHWEYFVAQ